MAPSGAITPQRGSSAGLPWSSISQPCGILTRLLCATRSLPWATALVAMSRTNGGAPGRGGAGAAHGIGSEAPVGAGERRNASERLHVDEMHRHQAFGDGHFGPVADAPEVVRIAECGDRHAVLLRALDRHARRLQSDRLAVSRTAVESEQRARIELHLDASIRMQPALEQRLDIARHHADAVRIVPGEVCRDKVLRDELRLRGLTAARGGNRGDGAGQALLREDEARHSGLMPPRLTTSVQRSTSSFMKRPNSSGVLATTSKPIWPIRSRTSGERSAFTVASFSFVTMSRWVFAGAATACQEVTTSAGNPASDVVGTFGSWGFRAFAVTASAFIRLPRM